MKIKKIIIPIIFMLLFIANIGIANAVEIDVSGQGSKSQKSATCSGTIVRCGNTVGIYNQFPNSTIYGMRVTLVNSRGYAISEYSPVNFWADKKMVDYIETDNSLVKTYTANYSNEVFNKLYSYSNGGLRTIETSGVTYIHFFKDLNVTDLNYIIKKINSDLTLDSIDSKNYYLKIEPILVVHFGIRGNHYYLQGTPKEIIKYVYDTLNGNGTYSLNNCKNNNNNMNDWRSNFQCDYYWISYVMGLREGSNFWNVLYNYLVTTYMNKDSNKNGTNFPTWTDSIASGDNKLHMYQEIANGSDKSNGLAVGYISVRDYRTKLVVTKTFGTPSSNNLANQKVCFHIYKKIGSNSVQLSYNGQTQFCNPYPDDKWTWNDSADWNTKARHEQVIFNYLEPGYYMLEEVGLSDDIEKVYFYQRTDKVGDYSLSKGVITPSFVNKSIKNKAKSTGYFEVKAGKTTYAKVINQKAPENVQGKIVVSKHAIIMDGDGNVKEGYDINDYHHYNKTVTYELYDSSNTKISTKKKPVSGDTIVFDNLPAGTYYIKEVSIPSSIGKVHFYKKNGDDYVFEKTFSVESETVNSAQSNGITISNTNKNVYYKIYNESKELTCSNKLDNIKANTCGSSSATTCTNKPKVIKQLFDLYIESLSEGDFNKLLNFKFVNNDVDISGVSCTHVDCSGVPTLSGTCDTNNAIESSKPVDNNIDRRVCYISDGAATHNSFGNYENPDLDAYCEVNYSFNLALPNETVKAGMILWHQLPNYISNNKLLKVNVKCEGAYDNYTELEIFNRKMDMETFIDDVLPNITILWRTNRETFSQKFTITPSATNQQKTDPNVNCTGSGDDSYCYAVWEQNYNFYLIFEEDWYTLDSSGRFFKEGTTNGLTGFYYYGKGLPISIKEQTSNNLKAWINIKVLGENIPTLECPYSVKNEIMKCPSGECEGDDPDPLSSEFNFDFRIIDTSNPFPGIDGNGRYVGDNWCADSRIGTIEYTSSGTPYMVGDVIDDNFNISGAEFQTSFSSFTLTNKPSADIDGDGAITYSNNCVGDVNDYCILQRYVTRKENANRRKMNCVSDSAKNNIIKKYITDAPNSNSTGRPMYSFTLTPEEIQNIRAYNNKHAYNDFNMVCDTNQRNCLSNFLTDWIKKAQVNSKTIKVRVTDANSSCYYTRSIDNKLCTNN